jgi:AcrR family transcriptional regulator
MSDTAARKRANRARLPEPESPWSTADQRAVERARKRDAVILAAARAFKQRGYHNTSLDDIAAILHVTKPTIYHYVENKEQILFECFRTGLDQIRSAFGEVRRSACLLPAFGIAAAISRACSIDVRTSPTR